MSNDCTVAEAIAMKEELRAAIQSLCTEYTGKTGVVVSVNVWQHTTRLGNKFSGYCVDVEVNGLLGEKIRE